MPTSTGAETVTERLTRLRTELARVRQTIARHETSGGSRIMGGVSVTEIAYERALDRQRVLERDIAGLESRLSGGRSGGHVVQIQSKGDD